MYFRGDGVSRRSYEALQWMRRSAQNGFLPAQKAVGRLYMTGLEEMGQDLAEARSWLSLAASRGDAEARRWLPQIEQAERPIRPSSSGWPCRRRRPRPSGPRSRWPRR